MSEWVKCCDRMPAEDQKVLIAIPVCGYFEVEGASYNGDGTFDAAWCSTKGKGKPYAVFAWAPFPDISNELRLDCFTRSLGENR